MIYGPSLLRRAMCVAFALLALCPAVSAQNRASVSVRPVTAPPVSAVVLIDGRAVALDSAELVRSQQVMVWIRDLEKLGWGTVMPSSPEQIIFQGKSVTLTFNKGKDVALVNSLSVQMPIDTFSREGRFMVPLSFVAKALGYDYECSFRPVATIATSPVRISTKPTNSLTGRVIYNGKACRSVRVRLADPEFNLVKGFDAVTNADGVYSIEGLPDGAYMAYTYIKDNPLYFNRKSDTVVLGGGENVRLRDIALGKVLTPLRPKVDQVAAPANGRISFMWTACEGTATYKLIVRKHGSSEIAAQAMSQKPTVSIPATKLAPGAKYDAEVSAQNANGAFIGGTAGPGGKAWAFAVGQ